MRKQEELLFVFAILIGLFSSYLVSCSAYQSNLIDPSPTKTLPKDPMEVSLLTSDGIALKANYYPSLNSDSKNKLLILLHGAYEDSTSWNGFRKTAQEAGFAVFTMDFRGHGQSDGEKTFDASMDNDVEAALDWLHTSLDVSEQQIALIGESLGANLALRAGARHPGIPTVILLSPGMSLWDIRIKEAIVDYGSRPLLMVAAEEDGYPAETVRQLDELAQGTHKLLLLPGGQHGAEMIDTQSNLANLMLTWLQETFP